MIELTYRLIPPSIDRSIDRSLNQSSSSALAAITDQPEAEAPIQSLFLAGSLSGAATVLVTTPTDLVKIRLQLQMDQGSKHRHQRTGGSSGSSGSGGNGSSNGSGSGGSSSRMRKIGGGSSVSGGGGGGGGGGLQDTFRCARAVYAAEGVRGFYRGVVATAYRDTWSTGLYFVTYHTAKRRLDAWNNNSNNQLQQQRRRQQQQQSAGRSSAGGGESVGTAAATTAATSESAQAGKAAKVPSPAATPAWVELTSGGLAGITAWGSVVPFDVVKTRLQVQAAASAAASVQQ